MEKIAIAQTTSSGNWSENLRKAEQFIKRAKAEKAKMIVFPEYFMNYYPDADHKYIEKAQTLHGTPLDHKIYLLHRNLHLSAKRGLHEKKNRL